MSNTTSSVKTSRAERTGQDVVLAQPHMPVQRENAVPAPAVEAGLPAAKEQGVLAARPQTAPPSVRPEGALNLRVQTPPANVPPQAEAASPGQGMRRPFQPRPMLAGNPYAPLPATVREIISETANIKTLRVVLDDEERMASFTFEPGQVGQLSVFGVGEATFVINSPPSQKDYLQFSVMRAGEVTAAIHKLSPGDKVGVRAPLGNFFPWQDWKGKSIFFVGGGIGMAPIRTIMLHVLERKADGKPFGRLSYISRDLPDGDLPVRFPMELLAERHFFPCRTYQPAKFCRNEL